MGFNKVYVPEYDVLVKQILTLDSSTFVRRYLKADALIGPSRSIKLLNDYLEEYYEGSENLKESFIKRIEEGYDNI
jgi:hypothetical protein